METIQITKDQLAYALRHLYAYKPGAFDGLTLTDIIDSITWEQLCEAERFLGY